MDEIRIGEKTYISSKKAALITGYAKDYVGQLCREGYLDAKMVGRSWYVYEPSIRAHRFGAEEKSTESLHSEPVVTSVPDEPVIETPVWEPSTYQSEVVSPLPSYEESKKSVNALQQHIVERDEALKHEHSLTDMQNAWKEWFERKQNVDLLENIEPLELETAEVIEERRELYEQQEEANEENEGAESVTIARLSETSDVYAENVPINTIHHKTPTDAVSVNVPKKPAYEEGRVIHERILPKPKAIQARSAALRNSKKTAHPTSFTLLKIILVATIVISAAFAIVGTGLGREYISKIITNNTLKSYLVGERVIIK